MISEPMLAGKPKKGQALKFPRMASVKLDGIRALVIGGKVLSRQFIPIPNAWVQRMFSGLPEGTDGELVHGDAADDPYRRTVSAVMSEDGEPTAVCFHVFDNFTYDGGFQTRIGRMLSNNSYLKAPNVFIVPHSIIASQEQLDQVEEIAVNAGYEGIMSRSLDGPYKEGRSTANQGYLLKHKQFEDAEAVILGYYEWEKNTNSAMTSATGHTERSSHKAGMQKMGVLGGFDVRGLNGTYKDVEFSVGGGFKGAADPNKERGQLWRKRDQLIGLTIKFSYFATGSKEKPRFPVFRGFRSTID